MHQYGNRCPPNYKKQKILGKYTTLSYNYKPLHPYLYRGGFAIVWLGKNLETGLSVAMKQITHKGGHGTQKRELRIGRKWFGQNGEPYEEIQNHPGIQNIAALMDTYSSRQD